MPGLEKLIKGVVDDMDVQRDIGYLTRAVEDLTGKLEYHMVKEEQDRKEAVREFSEYRHQSDSRFKGIEGKVEKIETKIQAVEKSTAGIKTFIVGTGILFGLLADVVDKATVAKMFSKLLTLL